MVNDDHVEKLNKYIELLLKWNSSKRLVGPKSEAQIVNELILDSILPVVWVKRKVAMVDIGSGAGIPGIPLKIFLPSLHMLMVEPVGKKVSFLREVKRLLGIEGLVIFKGKIEEAYQELLSLRPEVAISRAMKEPVFWVELFQGAGIHFGYIICYVPKGKAEEIKKKGLGPYAFKDSITYGSSRCLILMESLCYSSLGDRLETFNSWHQQ